MGDKNFGDCVKLKHLINALSNNSELSLYFKALQSANPYIKFNCSYEINHVKTIKSLNDEQDEVAMNSVLAIFAISALSLFNFKCISLIKCS